MLEIPFIFSFRSEVYVEPFQTYIMDFFFEKIVNGRNLLYVFAKEVRHSNFTGSQKCFYQQKVQFLRGIKETIWSFVANSETSNTINYFLRYS